MTELKRTVINCTTGEVEDVPYTAEEISAHEAMATAQNARLAEEQAAAEALATLKASAKAKLVAGEPLTEEEAETLIL